MVKNLFKEGKEVIAEIEKHGHEAYFVGGCVRDSILGRPIDDIDITTSARPDEIQAIFKDTIPVGIEHGTVIVRHKGTSFEVTTYRMDGKYSDQRHPDSISFVKNIEEDLKRRDFTINALAMSRENEIIDLFNGKADLKQKRIRTVGNGVERFNEDPLRIMRGLRFSCQLGFEIESDTLTAMERTIAQLENIAVERLSNELEQFFAGDYISIGMNYLQRLEMDKHLPVFKDYPEVIQRIAKTIQPLLSLGEVFSLLHFYFNEISINTWIKEWKCSRRAKYVATQLSAALHYYEKNSVDDWLVYQLHEKLYPSFIRVVQVLFQHDDITLDKLYKRLESIPIHSKRDLQLNGNDLLDLFPERKTGPWLNQLLTALEKAVVLRKVGNTKNELKEWLKWNQPEVD